MEEIEELEVESRKAEGDIKKALEAFEGLQSSLESLSGFVNKEIKDLQSILREIKDQEMRERRLELDAALAEGEDIDQKLNEKATEIQDLEEKFKIEMNLLKKAYGLLEDADEQERNITEQIGRSAVGD